MEHKKLSRYLLLAGALAGVGGILVFFLCVPWIARWLQHSFPGYPCIYWITVLYGLCIWGLYGGALWQYFGICLRIGRNQSFCPENARGLLTIAFLLFTAGGLLLLASLVLPLLLSGPFWLSMLLAAIATAAMGMLAWALGKLVKRAAALQEENDLTI